jgi:hypothetical protein
LFADYRMIFVVRDGRRVVASKVRRAQLAAPDAAARWMEGARIHRVLAAVLGARLLTLRYEALLEEPEATLRAACAFLGLAFQAQMLAGAERGYANEAHAGFDRASLDAPLPAGYDEWLAEGLLHFNYPMS